jgi:hypothetical protein
MVHPVPAPVEINKDPSINNPLKGSSQKLKLFNRGKHIS